MALARWQATITDENGDIVPNASVTVRSELTGALAALKADRDGAVAKSNPFTADANGFAFFYTAGGAYKITAVSGAFSQEWRHVGVGRASETDLQLAAPAGAWSGATSYSTGSYVYHETYLFVSLQDDNLNNEPDHTTPGDTAYWMFLGAAAQGPAGTGDKFDIPVYIEDQPANGEVYPRIVMTGTVDFADDFPASQAKADVAADSEAVFSIKKNGSEVGTITFAAAGTTGVFASSGAVQFEAGDILTIVAPSPQDATLADISITLTGTR